MDERTDLGAREPFGEMDMDAADPADPQAGVPFGDTVRSADPVYSDAYDVAAGAEIDTGPTADEQIELQREQVERTRADMSETIDAIQEKLSPGNLAQQAKDTVKEATVGRVQRAASDVGDTATNAGSSIIDTIRQNPVPAALAGLGIGWLFMSARQQSSRGRSSRYDAYRAPYTPGPYRGQSGFGTQFGSRVYGSQYGTEEGGLSARMSQAQDSAGQAISSAQDRAGQVASQVTDTAGEVAGQVSDTAGQVVQGAQQTAGQIADQAQWRAQQAAGGFQQMLQENPLAVGAAAIAVGAAIGLAIPETPQEDQWMGGARENLMQRAQETVQQTAEKVGAVAQETISTAKDTAQQAAQDQGLTSS